MTFDYDFSIFSSSLFPSFFRREEKRGERITKVVVKSHAVLLDHSIYAKFLWNFDRLFSFLSTLSRLFISRAKIWRMYGMDSKLKLGD